jgi:hypothetical protein
MGAFVGLAGKALKAVIKGKIDLFQNEKQGEICQHEKRVF